MWLFDKVKYINNYFYLYIVKAIYYNMSTFNEETLVVNRGIALHKMIRFITLALGGDVIKL